MKQMDIVTYESQWKWSQAFVETPTWAQVEEAVRSLHPFSRPFMHLFLGQPDLVEDYMSIIGGSGRYWVGATVGEQDILCVADSSRGNETIPLWTSDQGFSSVSRHVCADINVVLAAARQFFENGTYAPDLTWEPDV